MKRARCVQRERLLVRSESAAWAPSAAFQAGVSPKSAFRVHPAPTATASAPSGRLGIASKATSAAEAPLLRGLWEPVSATAVPPTLSVPKEVVRKFYFSVEFYASYASTVTHQFICE